MQFSGFLPIYFWLCIIRGVTVSSPLVNSARGLRKPKDVSMTMERARLALKSFVRPLSSSNIGSESLKIRNMCRLPSHYTTPIFTRARILHPPLLGLLKAHTFRHLILPFLPVRDGQFVNFMRAHCVS